MNDDGSVHMMALTVLALVVGGLFGLCTGGRPQYLAQHRVQAWWLLLLGVSLQLAAARLDLGGPGMENAVVVAGYVSLLVFAAFNRSLVGMGIVAVGLAANALVIGINGGMPVRPAAVAAAGVNYGRLHHPEGPGDRLSWLGDVIPARPLHLVVSFGDLILAVGVADVVAHALHRRRRAPVAA
jgi:hypothetical protein